jgi:hypothetical protein
VNPRRVLPGLVVLIFVSALSRGLLAPVDAMAAPPQSVVSASLRPRALQILRTALEREAQWIKVHAAEALLDAGEPQGVAREFERELASKGGEPRYRIGIWRVLARTAPDDRERQQWVGRIVAAFLDTAGPDRLHAAEALAKLDYHASGQAAEAFDLEARLGRGSLAADARWVLANSGRADGDVQLADLLASDDISTRTDAAYAIRYLPKISAAAWDKVSAAARKEASGSSARASLLSPAFVHAPADLQASFKAEVVKYLSSGTNDEKYEACAALAQRGREDDVIALVPLLYHRDADVRIGAAHAVLRIGSR